MITRIFLILVVESNNEHKSNYPQAGQAKSSKDNVDFVSLGIVCLDLASLKWATQSTSVFDLRLFD